MNAAISLLFWPNLLMLIAIVQGVHRKIPKILKAVFIKKKSEPRFTINFETHVVRFSSTHYDVKVFNMTDTNCPENNPECLLLLW